MLYQDGKFDLSDVNNLMVKINQLTVEIELLKAQRSIKTNIDDKSNYQSLLNVDVELFGLKADIDNYRENLKKSKFFLQEFKALKKQYLRSNFFPLKMNSK